MHFIFSCDNNSKSLKITGIYELAVKSSGNNELFAYASLIFAMLLYGSTFLAMKVLLNEYNPVPMIAIRMVMAAILFLPFLFTTYKNIKIHLFEFDFDMEIIKVIEVKLTKKLNPLFGQGCIR